MTQVSIDQIMESCPVMVILRGVGPERSLALAELAWGNGIENVEITIQSDSDLAALRVVAEAGQARGKPVGAGTVTSVDLLHQAVSAGAAYVVSPGLDEEVVTAAQAAGIPMIPGVATATEVQAAARLGITWMKAFPAQQLGTGWLKSMKGPFPEVRFVATGGMTPSSANEFLEAGAEVVGVGSVFEDPEQLAELNALLARHQGR